MFCYSQMWSACEEQFQYPIRHLIIRFCVDGEVPRNREMGNSNYCNPLKFGRRLGNSAVETPGKIQSQPTILNTNAMTARDLIYEAFYRVRTHVLCLCYCFNSLWPSDARHMATSIRSTWLGDLRHQVISWTDVDFSSVIFSDIHRRATSQPMPKPLFCIMSLKFIF